MGPLHSNSKIFIIVLLFIQLNNCNNIKENNLFNKEKMSKTNNVYDSLKDKGYELTKEIDYFNFEPINSFEFKNDNLYFGFIKNENEINILKVFENKILENRKIKRYSKKFFIEKQVRENIDAGEINYLTFYYSKEKIIIFYITKNIFEDNENDYNYYLSDVFIIDKDLVYNYHYKLNSDFHLNSENFILSDNELENIDKNVLTYFASKKEVLFSKYKNVDFAKNMTFIWQYFLLETQ